MVRLKNDTYFWFLGSIFFSLENAIFQVTTIRILPFVLPFFMLFLISLITAISFIFSGIGLAISNKFTKYYKSIFLLSGTISPLLLIFLFVSKSLFSENFTIFSTISLISISLPTILIGTASGICFQQTLEKNFKLLKWLIAGNAIAFFIGFSFTNKLFTANGLFSPMILITFIPIVLMIRKYALQTLIILIIFSCFISDRLFPLNYKNFLEMWNGIKIEKYISGKWSPYSRIDFVEIDNGKLAGIYNGKQQWVTSPKANEDFDFRHKSYKNVYGDTLVIGTGGGHGLLSLTNSTNITAVELDPDVINILKGSLSKYNNNIYNKIKTIPEEGRAFLEETTEKFDNIIYEGTDFTVSFSHRLFFSMEHYLYTKEGVQKTFDRLKENGILIALHTSQTASTRGLIKSLPKGTYYRVWEGTAHAAIDFNFIYLVASKNKMQVEKWKKFMTVNLPETKDVTEISFSQNEINSREAITDKRPLLFFEKYEQIIPVLLPLIISILVLSFFIFKSEEFFTSINFPLIGISYILIELFIINIYRSWLGSFLETTAISLGSLIISNAIGNIIYNKLNKKLLLILTPLASILLIFMSSNMYSFNILSKEIWIIFSIFPIGLCMGAIFPKTFETTNNKYFSKFLAIDTLGSAIGFFLFYISIIIFGLTMPIVISTMLYFIILIIMIKKRKRI